MTSAQMAAIVVDAVKAHTAPLVARIAQLEAQARALDISPMKDIGALRERVAVQETKWDRIAEIEAKVAEVAARAAVPGPAGKDGASVTEDDVRPLVASSVEAAVKSLPVPRDGKDGASVTVDDIRPLVASAVEIAVKSLPVPRDGKDGRSGDPGRDGVDGKSVSVDDVRPIIAEAVAVAVKALPAPRDGKDGADGPQGPAGPTGEPGRPGSDGKDGAPGAKGLDGANGRDGIDGAAGKDGAAGLDGKDGRDGIDGKNGADGLRGKDGADGVNGKDGIGLTGALVDRAGHLMLTLSDGSTKDVGLVVGRDGSDGLHGKDIEPDAVKAMVQSVVDAIPRPKDGADGLGFDDMDILFDTDKGYRLRWSRGERVVEKSLPLPFDAGVWQAGRTYPHGAGVTFKGQWCISQRETSAEPLSSKDWRLAVKAGRDGKPGPMGPRGGDDE